MATALYDSVHGYYTSGIQRVGKGGDFITSVSIGRIFGLILARRLEKFWREIDQPRELNIIEPGAHDGTLCADILHEARKLSPEFYNAIQYHLVEAAPSLTSTQQKKLMPEFAGKFTTQSDLSELHNLHGAIISNELIDAFPVDLIRFEQHTWHQLMVDTSPNGNLIFTSAEITDPELCSFCKSLSHLGTEFPEGYTTEYNPGIARFTKAASRALASGLFITIDYGHLAEDYYHPDRVTGTLQTYHHHRNSNNPLESPGEIDITSHVDFSQLRTSAESDGFEFSSFTPQANYLTHHAREWLLSLEASPSDNSSALIRQFQTLTHPAMLGTKFQVLEMKK